MSSEHPVFHDTTLEKEVIEIEGEDYWKAPWILEFSNGKKFFSDDKSDNGIYDGT